MNIKNNMYSIVITAISIFFIFAFIINNATGRTYMDGIREAEIHHQITGKYYLKYYKLQKIELQDTIAIKIIPYDDQEYEFTEIYFNEYSDMFHKIK